MKVWTISMAFNDAEIIKESIDQYYATHDPRVETVHILIDQHWPVDYRETRKELERLSERYGMILFDPGQNLGLAKGFTWAWKKLSIPDNAMVIGYDPDSWPDRHGWDMAMCEAFVSDPKVGWLSLWHQHSERELITEGRSKAQGTLGGHRVAYADHPAMNSVCGFRQGWLRKVGGLFEQNPLYGGLECDMWKKLKDEGYSWAFLRDWTESPHFSERGNPLYRQWKWETTHCGKPQIQFEDWLRAV